MKKLLCAIACLLLVGCGNPDDSKPTPGTVSYPNSYREESEDFIYELEVSPTKIASGEEINIVAKLTYIGDEDEIVISHAASPFYFDLYETTRGYDIYYFMDTPNIGTTLKKGEPLVTKYRTTGGFGEEQPEEFKQFMKAFLSGNYPEGYYKVHGYVKFTRQGESKDTTYGGFVGFKVN